MSKFIIDNQSSAADVSAFGLVMEVVSHGKISNNGQNYCYVSTYTTNAGNFIVYARNNEKSFKFTVIDAQTQNTNRR